MKLAVVAIIVLTTMPTNVMAQLSGTYTVGGDSPDFITPQDAADSLVSLGISGPVEVLIRPGVYESGANGDVPALSIVETINGLDAVNRVSFRADAAAGGDTSNVILTRRVGSPVISISPASLQSTISHITLEGFAVAVEDTSANVSALDPAIVLKGRVVDPMREVRVVGLKISGGGRRASVAISIQECGIDFVVERNVITDAARAADIECVNGSGFRFVDNLVQKTGYRRRGANPAIPTIVGMDLANGDAPIIEGNVIDMTGQCGSYILRVFGGDRDAQMRNARVVGNRIINYACGGGDWGTTGGAINVRRTKGYTLVANNMVSVGTTASLSGFGGNAMVLTQDFDSMLVAHNTVYAWQNTVGPRIIAPEADGAHAVIVNNILVNENKSALAVPSGSFTRDYNVLSNGSDIGPNSIITTPEFVDTRSDLHLEECAFADESLTGMHLPEVPVDFDVEARHSVAPFVGADEPAGGPPQVFSGPTLFASGTRSFLMASADLDDDGDIDLAVTNVEPNSGGNDVTILLNNGAGVFSDPQHLPFGTDPTQIEIGYVNGGDILDLVALAGDGIHVRFGAGGGNFSPPSTVVGEGPWTDIELADYDDDGDTDVFTLRSPPADSAEVVVYINEGDGTFVFNNFWTVGRYADDLEIVDLDGDGFLDLLVVDNTSTSQLYTMRNRGTRAPGVSDGYDPPLAYPYSVESVPAASQFLVGDFDGDLDPDVILGDAMADSLVLIRNNGDGTLGAREAFGVHRRGAPRTATMLDYEGDGDLDLVVASQGSTVDLMLNDGSGMFSRFALCGNGVLSGFPNAILASRLDDDMSTDIAVLTTNDKVEILKNLNWTSPIANEEANDQPSESSRLYPNYPNPLSNVTTVRFALGSLSPVRVDVFDIVGRRVATLLDETRSAGEHSVRFDASGLASGVYLYRVSAGPYVETRRMVVVK